MKILIVSNLYPPHHHGGYELRCAQVADYLTRQGHAVRVVTSDYQITGATHGAAVREESVNGIRVSRLLRQHRLAPWQPGGRLYNLDVVKRQIVDLSSFRDILDEWKPDLINWWNLEGVTKVMLGICRDRGLPSVHCVDDGWMIQEFGVAGDIDAPFWLEFWRVKWGPRLLRPVVRLCLAPLERRLQRQGLPTRTIAMPQGHVCFISEFWRFLHEQAGFDVESSSIIYGGVSPERFFSRRAPADYADGPLRLLYSGHLDRRRGLHTIVEALGLIPAAERNRMHLSIAHTGPVPADAYVNGITARIAQLGLSQHITFLGRVPHDEMPGVYAAHHVLVFASTRNEGMPMVMMEAMCAGCAVPNTGSGGAIELAERAGTPLFPKDHAFALSRLLTALEKDRARVADIALRGQQTVLNEFTIDRMLEKACAVFTRAARQPHTPDLQPASR